MTRILHKRRIFYLNNRYRSTCECSTTLYAPAHLTLSDLKGELLKCPSCFREWEIVKDSENNYFLLEKK